MSKIFAMGNERASMGSFETVPKINKLHAMGRNRGLWGMLWGMGFVQLNHKLKSVFAISFPIAAKQYRKGLCIKKDITSFLCKKAPLPQKELNIFLEGGEGEGENTPLWGIERVNCGATPITTGLFAIPHRDFQIPHSKKEKPESLDIKGHIFKFPIAAQNSP